MKTSTHFEEALGDAHTVRFAWKGNGMIGITVRFKERPGPIATGEITLDNLTKIVDTLQTLYNSPAVDDSVEVEPKP